MFASLMIGVHLASSALRCAASAAALEALADPAVQKRLSDLGQEIPPADQQGAAALGAHLKAEMDKWTPIIKDANIKVD